MTGKKGSEGGGRGKKVKGPEVRELQKRTVSVPVNADDLVSTVASMAKVITAETCSALTRAAEDDGSKASAKCRKLVLAYLVLSEPSEKLDGVRILLEHKDFVPLMKKWLTAKDKTVQREGIIILEKLMESSKVRPHLRILRDSKLISCMPKSLIWIESDVCDRALKIIAKMLTFDLLVQEVLTSPGLFPALTKLAKRDNSATLPKGVSYLLFQLSRKVIYLSLRHVKTLLPIFQSLMTTKDIDALALTVTSVGLLWAGVTGAFDIFLGSSLIVQIVALLSSDAAKEIHPHVVQNLVRFTDSLEKGRAFFKNIYGTSHLKNFNLAGLAPQHTKLSLEFLNNISALLNMPLSKATVNAMINCGVIHSVAQCISTPSSLELTRNAATVIGQFCSLAYFTDTKVLVDAGMVHSSVELLESTDIRTLILATVIVSTLMRQRKSRDQCISAGVTDKLLNILGTYGKNAAKLVRSTLSIFTKASDPNVKPLPPFSFYSKLPARLEVIADHYARKREFSEDTEDIAASVFKIIQIFFAYGAESKKRILDSDLVVVLVPFVASQSVTVKMEACSFVDDVMENASDEQKCRVLNAGIFFYLESLLKDKERSHRKLALKCLWNYFKMELPLNSEHVAVIRHKLAPCVDEEMKRGDPETQNLAGTVLGLCVQIVM